MTLTAVHRAGVTGATATLASELLINISDDGKDGTGDDEIDKEVL